MNPIHQIDPAGQNGLTDPTASPAGMDQAQKAQALAMLSKEELLEIARPHLTGIIEQDIDIDFDWDQFQVVLETRRGNLYWSGNHYHALRLEGNELKFTTVGTPIAGLSGTGAMSAIEAGDEELFNTVVNNYRGLGRKFIGVIGAKPPRVFAIADNVEDQESEEAAEQADIAIRVLNSWWDAKHINRRLLLGLWKSNTMFIHVRYRVDGDLWGVTEEPVLEPRPREIAPAGFECTVCGERSPAPGACLACGAPIDPAMYRPPETAMVPVQVGTKLIPNGRTDITPYDVLSVTVPTYATSISDCDWLKLEKEVPKGRLLQIFPQHREKILGQDKGSSSTTPGGESSFIARSERDSPVKSSQQHKNLITFRQYWLALSQIEMIEDEPIREALKLAFPDGIRATKIGDHIIEIENERLSDVWEMCQPDVSDTIYTDSLGKDYIPVQDAYNDATNIGVETMTRQLPTAVADPEVIDLHQLAQRSFRPAEILPAKKGARMGNLSEGFYALPKAEMNEQMLPFIQALNTEGQNITGILPSIYGGEGPSQTAHEAEMKKNQALQQLSLQWDNIRQCWAKVFEKGIKQLAKYATKMELAPGDEAAGMEAEVLDPTRLAQKGWHCESDEAFPMSYAQQRDQIQMTLQGGPEIVQMLGLMHPMNKPLLHRTLGFPGLYTPDKDLVDYIFSRIRLLLKSAPLEQIDPITGMPKLQPSMQPDPFIEANGQACAEIIRCWCLSKAGQAAAKKKPEGFANVLAYGQMHEEIAAEQAMLAAQAGQDPASGQGGPGPGPGQTQEQRPAPGDGAEAGSGDSPGGVDPADAGNGDGVT